MINGIHELSNDIIKVLRDRGLIPEYQIEMFVSAIEIGIMDNIARKAQEQIENHRE